MENKSPFSLPHHDLDTNSINPSITTQMNFPNSVISTPNFTQLDYPISDMDIEWVNNFLFAPMKLGNPNPNPNPNYQDPSSSSSPLGVTSRVCSNTGDIRHGDDGSSSVAGGSSNNRKASGRSRKSVPPRVAFHTRSPDDVLDDGYRWRKYGQKAVKNSGHPRSYYRCTHHTCNVKKQIQRLGSDSSIVVTTYEGRHNHPSEKLMETLAPLLKQLQFLTRF